MSSRVGKKPVLSMQEMVRKYVPDGSEILIGGFAFSDPTAFAHELIRQGRRDLFVMKTAGGVLVDQLIGAGCVRRVLSAHIWNSVGPVAAHCFRRAAEKGVPRPIEIDEMSYGVYTSALYAGAAGLPFMPTTPVQGAGHFTHRSFYKDKFAVVTCPFTGRPVCVVPPLRPKLGVFHVQRVDEYGNAQMLGPTGEMKFAMNACERTIIIAEELVDTEVIRARPELTVIPGFKVEAIVIEPWSAHPTDAYGYYCRDLQHHSLYGEMSKTEEGFRAYLEEWVLGTRNHREFLQKLGEEHLRGLMAREERWW